MHYTENGINSLITRFESQKLPKSEWTHEAHLAVAIWYNLSHNPDKALKLVRGFIINHNLSVGTSNTDTGGYHETITRFWLITANSFIKSQKSGSATQLCNDFIHSKFASNNFPLEYYSPGCLFSLEARQGWVKPDLRGVNPL